MAELGQIIKNKIKKILLELALKCLLCMEWLNDNLYIFNRVYGLLMINNGSIPICL